MFTSNTVEIKGQAARILPRIYQLAADIQDWPAWLPHYQYMRILEQSDAHKVADFGAVRRFGLFEVFANDSDTGLAAQRYRIGFAFPCRWRARQELFPNDMRITYKHIRGITRGMWVEWRLEERGDHVHVTIDHELNYAVPLLGPFFAKYIVGKLFVHAVAGKTLQCLKEKVEAEAE